MQGGDGDCGLTSELPDEPPLGVAVALYVSLGHAERRVPSEFLNVSEGSTRLCDCACGARYKGSPSGVAATPIIAELLIDHGEPVHDRGRRHMVPTFALNDGLIRRNASLGFELRQSLFEVRVHRDRSAAPPFGDGVANLKRLVDPVASGSRHPPGQSGYFAGSKARFGAQEQYDLVSIWMAGVGDKFECPFQHCVAE